MGHMHARACTRTHTRNTNARTALLSLALSLPRCLSPFFLPLTHLEMVTDLRAFLLLPLANVS